MSVETLQQHELLIDRLMHHVGSPEEARSQLQIETHISTIMLRGEFAYKIKKPLDLDFLDYSTLERRKQACDDELRLNSRLAPQLYLGVMPVTGSLEEPRLGGSGPVIDWAVKMRRFDPAAILAARSSELNHGIIERLARNLAHFHAGLPPADPDQMYGSPDVVFGPMAQNFSQIRTGRADVRGQLEKLMRWTEEHFSDLYPLLARRKFEGHIRECHGDLHLGNVALIRGEPVIFDGIEFDPALRWIDVISEVAFVTMDLTFQGRTDLSHWFLNHWLEQTGDFGALPLLRFYEVYRAMVRAKVNAIHGAQGAHSVRAREEASINFRRYLRIAEAFTRPGPRGLIITEGVVASGKSTLSGSLISRMPAVRVRSDIERKRLAGITQLEPGINRYNAGLYSSDMTERTYQRLADVATSIIQAGFVAVVDASFIRREHRQRFADLAQSLDVPFVILSCDAPKDELIARLRQRQEVGVDPSDATLEVLLAQLDDYEPLTPEERAMSLTVRPDQPLEMDYLVQRFR